MMALALSPVSVPATAAARELLEETGWDATGELEHLSTHHPSCGFVSQQFHLFLARGARHVGPPTDPNEAARIEWRSFEQVAADIRTGLVLDGFSLLGLTLALAPLGRADLLGPADPSA